MRNLQSTSGNSPEVYAEHLYSQFSKKIGSDHIASKFAIAQLRKLILERKPKKILEMGAGIGTLTTVICDSVEKDASVHSMEKNEFCLGQLKKNTADFSSKYSVYPNLNSIRGEQKKYDLIVADGGPYDINIFNRLNDDGIIFFEGNRFLLRHICRKAMRGKFSVKERIIPGREEDKKGIVLFNFQKSNRLASNFDFLKYVFSNARAVWHLRTKNSID